MNVNKNITPVDIPTTNVNTPNTDELEMKLMNLFSRSAEFGRVFLTSATKEEFAESVNNGALDPQEAAHEAMHLIHLYGLQERADEFQRVCDEVDLFTKYRNKAVYNVQLPIAYLLRRGKELVALKDKQKGK